ncbi:hypothetical protein BJ170DRAFT_624477 [Xylariales sp. AK1849]|nr:hypothetical protein BJ170DRAFT_624477 [Xylariales sp. AK1849]
MLPHTDMNNTDGCRQVIGFMRIFAQTDTPNTYEYGYIPEGPLFGWNYDPYTNCNSPFFYPSPPGAPHVNANDPNRAMFSCHYFTMVEAPAVGGDPVVLDACHAVTNAPAGLSRGTQNLGTYFSNSTDVGPPPDNRANVAFQDARKSSPTIAIAHNLE